MPITIRYTIGAGEINDVTKWDGGVALPDDGDTVQIKHAMTVDGAAYAHFPLSGTFASLDCASTGGASPSLTIIGTVEIVADIVTGIENLHDSGVAAVLTVNGSGETTLNQGYVCAGTTEFTGTVTGGGPALADRGIRVTGSLTATKVTGMSDTDMGVENAIGSITADVEGTSNSNSGVENSGTILADNITAKSTSGFAFYDYGGTLTEGAGAAGVNLTVRRLDGGQAVEFAAGTTISDELKITYVSNQTTPLVV